MPSEKLSFPVVVLPALAACLLVTPDLVLAQPMGPMVPPEGGSLTPSEPGDTTAADTVFDDLKLILTRYAEGIQKAARYLLFALLGADLVINTGKTVISNSSLSELLVRFIYRLLFVVFVLFVINNIADVVEMVAWLAIELAQSATETETPIDDISVSSILSDGGVIALEMAKTLSVYWLIYAICAVLWLVMTGIQVAMIILVFAELYIGALAGLITLAFAGLDVAKDAATRYITTVIGKGLAILTLLLVFSMFGSLALSVAGGDTRSWGLGNLFTVMMLQVICLLLMLTLPSRVESLAGGVGSTAAASIAGGAMATAAMVPVAMATAGVGAAGGAAAASGLAKGVSSAASGAGMSSSLKAAGAGAARTGGRYLGSTFSRGRSIRGEMANDTVKLANQVRSILQGSSNSSKGNES
ncbi:type IV secretion system protein [uncultured Ruegeria sp.]|uniref:type IV secretion system protein n=1 Tax=uncultured Ruegeria sp. TaxID=259304 RepID=UPI00262898EA|nr:type IV secretion system protein [uncultured Ruegeria sp.]